MAEENKEPTKKEPPKPPNQSGVWFTGKDGKLTDKAPPKKESSR